MTTPGAGSTSQPGDREDRPAVAAGVSGELVAYDQFIDGQLRSARRQVRTIDIAVSLITLGAGTVGFFLLAALFDHWLLPGGLGTLGRWLALVLYVSGALAYCWRNLLPLCIGRINPVYAAHAIERSKPTLKNSLINFLLLRSRPAELAPHVFEAIEQRAATELAQVPIEAAIDRSKLIKIGYAFLGLVVIATIYKVSSPKDPFQTVGRIVLPWANIAPPTRVQILDVRPGDSTVMRGQRAKISAEVHGVARQQTVRLVYSTDDGQIVDRPVPMQVPTEGYLFECELPEGKGGIQQDLTYRVVAGDATSNEFRLSVQAAPTIVVESVDYAYPSYTGMVNQTVDHQGDLKAIEGTQVTLHALANQPIKSATIDFDCNGTDDQSMTLDDRHATATVTLALKADRKTPEHASYQLRFTNADGKENPQPIRHQIEVTVDVAPEIQFLAPKRDEIDLPLNSPLVCEVSAHDPDFALARVALVGQSVIGQPFERSLLEESKDGQPWQGQFRKKLVLVPQKLGLKAGDVLEYWAWAEDNKTPTANHTETIHRRARIISPTKSNDAADSLAQGEQRPDEKPSGDRSDDNKQPDDQSKSPDEDNQPDKRPEPPKADASPPQNQRDGDRPPNADQRADDKDMQPDDKQRDNKQQDSADSKQDPAARDQDRNQADQTPGKQEQGSDPAEQDKSGEGQSGKGQSGQGQSGKEQSGKEQSGKEQSGQEKSGQGQSGKGSSGKGKSGKNSAGQEGSDQGESGGSSSSGGTQEREGQAGKPGARNQRGSDRSPDAKREPVANDGTQDGEAFDEIIERQNEREQTDSSKGSRQTTNRSSSTPPAHGTPNKQTGEQGSDDKQTAGKQESDEKTADRKEPGDKESGAKDTADKTTTPAGNGEKNRDKRDSEQRPNDGQGNDAGRKSAGDGEHKPQQSTKGENPGDRTDDKASGMDRSGGSEKEGEGKSGTDGQPAPDGKQSDGKSPPDGKSMNQVGEGAEKSPSNSDGQTKSGNPAPDKQTAGKPGAEKQGTEKQGTEKQGTEKQGTEKQGTEKQGTEKQGSGKQGSDKQATEQPGTDQQGAKKQAANKQTPDKQPANDPSEEQSAAGQPPAGASAEKKPMPQKSTGDGAEDPSGKGAENRNPEQPGGAKAGQGSQPPGKAGQKLTPKPNGNGPPQQKSGAGQEDQGESGAGQSGANDRQGSPKPQGDNRPTNKSPGHQDQRDGNREKSETPASPSGSDRQSDSEGSQDGDRSGGGKRGGGQKSQQDGAGGPGSHSKADNGGETASDENGQESSSGPDANRKSKEPTGQTGKTAGPGKNTDTSAGNGSKPADTEGKGSDSPSSDKGSGKEPSGKSGKAGAGPGGGNGGQTGEAEPPPAAPEQADAANLEFSRKATELTIQRMRDQLVKGEVDQELLDRLQWTQQDMERWVSRWEAMFRRSQQQGKDGQAARKELDATLRSLGLRPHGGQIAGHRQDDATHGMKEGRRTRPPAEYRDQVRQYMQGISRSGNGATTGRGATPPAAPAGNEK